MTTPNDSLPPQDYAEADKARGAGCAACSGSLAELVGFTATKGFRAARRAMRPAEGDTFITRRDGVLIFSQIDWIGDGAIGLGRFQAESGYPIDFVKIAADGWRSSVIRALRMGCEFRPANVSVEAPPRKTPNQEQG